MTNYKKLCLIVEQQYLELTETIINVMEQRIWFLKDTKGMEKIALLLNKHNEEYFKELDKKWKSQNNLIFVWHID